MEMKNNENVKRFFKKSTLIFGILLLTGIHPALPDIPQ